MTTIPRLITVTLEDTIEASETPNQFPQHTPAMAGYQLQNLGEVTVWLCADMDFPDAQKVGLKPGGHLTINGDLDPGQWYLKTDDGSAPVRLLWKDVREEQPVEPIEA